MALCFGFFDGAVKSEQVVEFLAALERQIAGKLPVIWDGAAIHRSRIVRAWLAQVTAISRVGGSSPCSADRRCSRVLAAG